MGDQDVSRPMTTRQSLVALMQANPDSWFDARGWTEFYRQNVGPIKHNTVTSCLSYYHKLTGKQQHNAGKLLMKPGVYAIKPPEGNREYAWLEPDGDTRVPTNVVDVRPGSSWVKPKSQRKRSPNKPFGPNEAGLPTLEVVGSLDANVWIAKDDDGKLVAFKYLEIGVQRAQE